jgi:DegV family protein with EDD domain
MAIKIVTDTGCDIPTEKAEALGIIRVPFSLNFAGATHTSDRLDPAVFYRMLKENPEVYPTTSQPSAGQFVEVYEKLIKEGYEIFSMHISSGLSGTYNSAMAAAEIIRQRYQDAKIHLWDTRTLSVAEGWQVLTAASLLHAGKSLDEIEAVLSRVREQVKFFFTLDTLKYLIHGGRISHIKGLMASLLNIRPIITVSPEGKYAETGKFVSFRRALQGFVPTVRGLFDQARELRVHIVHGDNPEGVSSLMKHMAESFRCSFDPALRGDIVMGAHTGESIVGMAVGYADDLALTA